MNATSTIGTAEWTQRTGGRLEPAERRRLIGDLAQVQVRNAVGRFSRVARLDRGRRSSVAPARLEPPDSRLTRAAKDAAIRLLPAALVNHSYPGVGGRGRSGAARPGETATPVRCLQRRHRTRPIR